MDQNERKSKLTPQSTRRHRQASDARWRANMYVCYALLKHSAIQNEYLNERKTRSGKITRVAALKQASIQLPLIEAQLMELLQEKNEVFNTEETLESVKEEFLALTQLANMQQIDVRKTKESQILNMSDNVEKFSNLVESVTSNGSSSEGYLRMFTESSASRTSIGTSYISDISSAIDGQQSLSQSPHYTSTQVSPGPIEDGMSAVDLANFWSLIGHECMDVKTRQLPQDTDDGCHKVPESQDDALDLELSQTVSNSTYSISTPKARARSCTEILMYKSPKCRRLMFDIGQMKDELVLDNEGIKTDALLHNFVENPAEADSDLGFYTDDMFSNGHKNKLIHSKSDPMISSYRDVKSHTEHMLPSVQNQEITSPWKSDDICLESFQFIP